MVMVITQKKRKISGVFFIINKIISKIRCILSINILKEFSSYLQFEITNNG